ncbi:MAG: hypothetical protein KKI08_04720 [Armatimonadetes bacterium]|nr:hypothetical protein [Armatimonadota bacterium]
MRRVCLLTGLLVLTTLCGALLCGCGGNGDGGGNNGEVVPLGANHRYADGDTWRYRVTGTYQKAGAGTVDFGPSVADLDYLATTELAQQAGGGIHLFRAEAQLTVGSFFTQHLLEAVAFSQDANGALTLEGYTPVADGSLPLEALVPPFAGVSYQDLPTNGDLTHSGVMGSYGDFDAITHFVCNETIAVPAGSFETSKVTATATLDGFTVDFVIWVNPPLGAPVRVEVHWDDYDGSTMDMTVVLTSTTVVCG